MKPERQIQYDRICLLLSLQPFQYGLRFRTSLAAGDDGYCVHRRARRDRADQPQQVIHGQQRAAKRRRAAEQRTDQDARQAFRGYAENKALAHAHRRNDKIRGERDDRAERAAGEPERFEQHNAAHHLDGRRRCAVLQHMDGGLLQLIRLVGVFGQPHEKHGERGVGDDRRARVVPRREQEAGHGQRHRGQPCDSRYRDQQIQPHALVEQRLGGGLSAVAPGAQHVRVYAAHDADRDHRKNTRSDRVVLVVDRKGLLAEKTRHQIAVDHVEQRDRDRYPHERHAVGEKLVQQGAGEPAQARDRRDGQREDRAQAGQTVREGVGDERGRGGGVIGCAVDDRISDSQLARRGKQAERDGGAHPAELDQRGVEDLEHGIAEEHARAAEPDRIARDRGRAERDGRDGRADQQIDG